MTDTIKYKTHVLPIFQKRCSPCHFQGGKMYSNLPFDDSSTIINHHEGILKRIKDEQEASLIKHYIQKNKVATEL